MSYKGNLENKDNLGKITPEDSLSVGVDHVSSLSRPYSEYSIDFPLSNKYNEEGELPSADNID